MMKRFLMVLVASWALGAAHEAKADVRLGVVAGTSFNKITYGHSFKDTYNSSNRMGYFIGPKVNVNLLGLGADVAMIYNKRREKLEDGYTKSFNSMEVPVNAKYTIGLSKMASISVATGPQFGFNLGDKDWKKINANDTKESFEQKRFVMSWNVGAGLRFLSHYELGVTYNMMLTNLGKYMGSENMTDAQNNHFKSNALNIHLGYYF